MILDNNFVINLNSSKTRLYDFQRDNDINFTRFDAVDGLRTRFVDVSAYLTHYENEDALIGGTLGCFMSHVKMMEQIASSADNIYVIFEDDVLLHKSFQTNVKKLVRSVNKYDKHWDLIIAGHMKKSTDPNNRLFYASEGGDERGTQCLIVRPRGARNLVRYLKPFDVRTPANFHNIDIFLTTLSSKVSIYCSCTPQLYVQHRWKHIVLSDRFWSDMAMGHVHLHATVVSAVVLTILIVGFLCRCTCKQIHQRRCD